MDKTAIRIGKFIQSYLAKNNGNSPSIREICKGTGLRSTSTVGYHLDVLEQANIIKRTGKKGRTRSIGMVGSYYEAPEINWKELEK